jgi:bacterial/archaeal transporter family-2 protein
VNVALELFLIALVAGAGIPVQAAFNTALARAAGRAEWAAFVNFGVGFLALGAWLAASRASFPAAQALSRAPAWAWLGGLLGAFYVSAVTHVAPRLGVAVTLGLTIAGTMFASIALDAVGALGLAVRPVTGARVLGAAFLVAGVLLVRR